MKPLSDKCTVNLSIQHVMIDYSKFTDARKVFKTPLSLHQAFNGENSKAICKFSTKSMYFIYCKNRMYSFSA